VKHELAELLAEARAALAAPDHGIDDAIAADLLERISQFEAMLARARTGKRGNPDDIAWHAFWLGVRLGDPMTEAFFQRQDSNAKGGRSGGGQTQKQRRENMKLKKAYEALDRRIDKKLANEPSTSNSAIADDLMDGHGSDTPTKDRLPHEYEYLVLSKRTLRRRVGERRALLGK
jgi:hypothetical protein